MIRSVFGKVMWVGRATVFLVGLAVILALVFGVATAAFAALSKPGDPFKLGVVNEINRLRRWWEPKLALCSRWTIMALDLPCNWKRERASRR
jgi:hypothetical protein